jgi:hypothetical protein
LGRMNAGRALGGSVLELDNNLKKLMKDLGSTINDALSDSAEINEAIQNVKNAGYDVFLVLEATIGFNRRDEDGELISSEDATESAADIQLKVNAQDMKFLKSLKINIDDLGS